MSVSEDIALFPMNTADNGQIFLWRVPEGFTLQHDPKEEPQDVAPVGKLSGHTRLVNLDQLVEAV